MLAKMAMRQLQQFSLIHSGYCLVKDPNNLKQVLKLSDHLLELAKPEDIERFADDLCKDLQALTAIESRYRVNSEALEKCRMGTLGRAYIEHLASNNITAESLTPPPVKDDLGYVVAHLQETHDIWHTVTGFDTSVAGELGLAAFGAAQMPSQFEYILLAGGILNTIFYKFDERDERMQAIVLGWQMGKKARPLFGVRWNKLWNRPLQDVRKELMVPGSYFEGDA